MSEERQERRRRRRFNLELPLWVRFHEKGRQEDGSSPVCEFDEEQTMTTAISAASCFFYVKKRPALGARARMRVEIPLRDAGRSGQVLCEGNVVWVSDRRVKEKIGVACTIDWHRIKTPGKA